ncbi:unnamed protein product [Microthlaspi erraticum]|uniref:Uncharacterized protein n=1 Tax=Microthlaspi erraticum TaxID=1685480 RepID=A0A6D2J321_9BRAS|nr:unnamed protein product [Microthlaspi erraticum]
MVDYVSSDHIYGVVGKSSSGVDGENLLYVAELMTMSPPRSKFLSFNLCLSILLFCLKFSKEFSGLMVPRFEIKDGDTCLADSATTHTILKDKKYFSYLKMKDSAESVSTICGSAKIILGSGSASFSLPRGTKFEVRDALYSPSLTGTY